MLIERYRHFEEGSGAGSNVCRPRAGTLRASAGHRQRRMCRRRISRPARETANNPGKKRILDAGPPRDYALRLLTGDGYRAARLSKDSDTG